MLMIAMGSVSTGNAFQPINHNIHIGISTSSQQLFANSQNIRAAMEASERYGPTSPEARLAWETVEEVDANDNSLAYSGNEEHRWTDEQLAAANEEIYNALQMVQQRTENLLYNQNMIKDVLAQMRAIKLMKPEETTAPYNPELQNALVKARAISYQYGNSSEEAKMAWEEVEEIASAGLQNAMGNGYWECNIYSAEEACKALDELDRVLHCKLVTLCLRNDRNYYE